MSTIRTRPIALFLVWILLSPSWLGAEALVDGLRRNVNLAVRNAKRVATQVGVHVVDLANGSEAYSYRGDVAHILASNTKLFTSAVALDRLGPSFHFETEILVGGAVTDGGILTGDLAVVGGGDPNLSGRHYDGDPYGPFREWASALRERGIRRIGGDLVLVHGLFADTVIHPDWPRNQLDRWYEAPVAALSFSDNCALIKVKPAARSGEPAVVEIVPALSHLGFQSTATTASRVRNPVRIGRAADSALFTISGQIKRQAAPVDRWVTVQDPIRYFGEALRAALAEEGIEHDGNLRPVLRLPDGDWRPVVTHRTDLLTTLEVVNKRSQNFYAEAVLKVLGARHCGDGTWQCGVQAVDGFLAPLGFRPGTYQMADGSGMSRNNRFAARQVTRLLTIMNEHQWGAAFMRTLPVSGEVDLSWEKRLARPPYLGNVLAKTGTLNGVSTLSGYAKGRSGRRYAFSILFNGAGAAWRSRGAQDAIVRALIDHG